MNLGLQRKKSIQANDLIHDQFLVLGKLDNKKHSSIILKGFDKKARNFVVIKITSAAYKEKNKIVTKILQKLRGGTGVPNIIWRGMEGQSTITVTECLGPNLKKLFFLMDKQFTIGTIAMIAQQVLNTLEYIHSQDYVCCNIMPKEILISLQKKNSTLFITDYKQARKVKSGKHVAMEQVSHTANKAILNKFSSVNLHLGLPASKKDDLESLGYIIVYFFRKGVLFDRNTKFSTKEEKIKYYEQQKLSIIPETFCQDLPPEMGAYMTYIKAMQTNQMNEKVDYDYLKKLFRNLFNKHSSLENFQYDWMSKARTYNMDSNGVKKDTDKNTSELYTRNEFVTFQSSRYQESEVDGDIDDEAPSEAVNLSTYIVNVQHQSEYDFSEMDEFEKTPTLPETVCVNKPEVFGDKVKTIAYVKRNSALGASPGEVFLQKQSHSDNLADHSTSENLDKSDDVQRNRLKSATEVGKMSKFGKAYVNNKSSKTS